MAKEIHFLISKILMPEMMNKHCQRVSKWQKYKLYQLVKILNFFKLLFFAISKFAIIKKLLEDVLQNGFLGIKAGEIELLKWNPTPPISIDMLRGI